MRQYNVFSCLGQQNADMTSTPKATSIALLFTWITVNVLLQPASCVHPDLRVTESGLFPPVVSDVALRFCKYGTVVPTQSGNE